MLGEGGFGSVYAGRRKTDNLPVVIKHINKDDVQREQVRFRGKTSMVPLEVLLMVTVGSGPSSVGKSAAVSILDWYDLAEEVLLVMERPVPCVDLLTYMKISGGALQEDIAKNIMKQMVDAAIQMLRNGVFHRDIKVENLLVETGSHEHRVRVIDFGCGCLVQEQPYSEFSGTEDFAPPEFFTDGRYEAVPTTVWQLGTLLYEMLDGKQQFSTSKFLRQRVSFNIEMSQDCKHFLQMCLTRRPEKRATLKLIQEHPWLQNPTKNKPCET
ncbi:unnamed protein product [Oreochromis niloticus]|nr:unnamed protein product [Mustela putorius furo]